MSRKTCTRCGKSKLISEFGRNRATRDGRNSWCRDCVALGKTAGWNWKYSQAVQVIGRGAR